MKGRACIVERKHMAALQIRCQSLDFSSPLLRWMSFTPIPKFPNQKKTLLQLLPLFHESFFESPNWWRAGIYGRSTKLPVSHHNGPQGLHWDLRLQQGWSHSSSAGGMVMICRPKWRKSDMTPGDAIIDVCEILECSKKTWFFSPKQLRCS